MADQTGRLAEIVKNDLGVKQSYQHALKPIRLRSGQAQVTPPESIGTNGAVLKWYALHPEDKPVPDAALTPAFREVLSLATEFAQECLASHREMTVTEMLARPSAINP